MNLTAYTDEALDALRIQVATEQERRANLARYPQQIAAMAKTYLDGGGELVALQSAITPDLDDIP